MAAAEFPQLLRMYVDTWQSVSLRFHAKHGIVSGEGLASLSRAHASAALSCVRSDAQEKRQRRDDQRPWRRQRSLRRVVLRHDDAAAEVPLGRVVDGAARAPAVSEARRLRRRRAQS